MDTSPSNASKYPNAKRYYQVVAAVFLSMSLLTACEKPVEPETDAVTNTQAPVQTTPVTSNINAPIETNEETDTAKAVTSPEQDISLTELESNLGTPDTQNDPAPSPEQAITGAQITDVKYRSAAGDSLTVVFETSASGVLNAIVTLPNTPKMTLSAPEGQGNNPTYHSSDGNITLISHGGGSSIDLIQNDQLTSYEAISADAEVITE